jgi:hypothetical protein
VPSVTAARPLAKLILSGQWPYEPNRVFGDCCEAGSTLVARGVNLDDRAAVAVAIGNMEGCDLPDFIDRPIAVARHG